MSGALASPTLPPCHGIHDAFIPACPVNISDGRSANQWIHNLYSRTQTCMVPRPAEDRASWRQSGHDHVLCRTRCDSYCCCCPCPWGAGSCCCCRFACRCRPAALAACQRVTEDPARHRGLAPTSALVVACFQATVVEGSPVQSRSIEHQPAGRWRKRLWPAGLSM